MDNKETVQVDVISEIKKLGNSIERQWKASNYKEEVFSEIAESNLPEDGMESLFEIETIDRWGLQFIQEVRQLGQGFGQPPITLYNGTRFYIEILIWMDATTAIHQHSFSGVFYVVAGSSIHSVYSFTDTKQVNQNLKFGNLEFVGVEDLSIGDYRKISSGSEFIHSLFHLDQPSATIVIRTKEEQSKQPQYSYLSPGLAYNPFAKSIVLKKQISLLKTLRRMNIKAFESMLFSAFKDSDLESVFHILYDLYPSGAISQELFSQLKPVELKESLFAPVRMNLQVEYMTQQILSIRSMVSERYIRYFIALVLLMPSRQALELHWKSFLEKSNFSFTLEHMIKELNERRLFQFYFNDLQINILMTMVNHGIRVDIMEVLSEIYEFDDLKEANSIIESVKAKILEVPLLNKLLFLS